MTILIAVAVILIAGVTFGLVALLVEARRGVDRAQRRNR